MELIDFESLQINSDVLKAIHDLGYTQPTPIQEKTIPLLLQGKDIIGQSQTGTGKTAAFAIPTIQNIEESLRSPQVLVLCPTRELAMQVSEEFFKLLKYKPKTKVVAIYGGASIDRQIQDLKRGVHIVVGTPGRIMDHLDRGSLHLDHTTTVVLDEADEMLDMGFRDDIEAILEEVPTERQTIFFSATMAKPILDLTARYQKNPEIVKITRKELTVEAIDQRFIEAREDQKPQILERLIDLYEPRLCLVFCNTKRKVDELVTKLQSGGFFAESLHGDMRQAMRSQVMAKFRQGIIQILVATDVAARGIDVEDISMVVNYDVPQDTEDYVHRIGRTGRAGRTGYAISLVTRKDYNKINDIERFARTKIKKDSVPSLKEIEHKKHQAFSLRIKNTIEEGGLEKYLDWVSEMEQEGITGSELAAALLKMEFHKQLSEVDKLSSSSFSSGDKPKRERTLGNKPRVHQNGMARLFINLGRKNKISPKDIVGAITSEAGLEGRLIGEIDIYDKFSFVEIPQEFADNVIQKMSKTNLRGQRFSIDAAVPRK